MRRFAVVAPLILVACTVTVPRPPALRVAVKTDLRARATVDTDAHFEVEVPVVAAVEAEVPVEAEVFVEAEVPVEIPVEEVVEAEVVAFVEPVAVEIEGAAVVEFFGVPLEGVDNVIFVLDRSGSMDEFARGRAGEVTVTAADGTVVSATRKIDAAQAELVDALERLPAGTYVNIIFFGEEIEAYAPGMFPLDETAREDVIAFVKETYPMGRTALAPAMRTAFLMNASRIVLLSDGLGNVGGNSAALLRDAREAMSGGVRIDTVGIGYDQDEALLWDLAVESGGLYQQL